MLKRLLLIIILGFIGCSSNLRVNTLPVERPKLEVPNPEPLKLENIKFYVITKENAIEVLNELEKKGLHPVIIGLDGTGYKILALNMDKIKNHIEILNEIIKQYIEYYER